MARKQRPMFCPRQLFSSFSTLTWHGPCTSLARDSRMMKSQWNRTIFLRANEIAPFSRDFPRERETLKKHCNLWLRWKRNSTETLTRSSSRVIILRFLWVDITMICCPPWSFSFNRRPSTSTPSNQTILAGRHVFHTDMVELSSSSVTGGLPYYGRHLQLTLGVSTVVSQYSTISI